MTRPISDNGLTNPTRPIGLTVDRLLEPIAIGRRRPLFGWRLEGPAPQTAYEIQVVDGDRPLWETGRTASVDRVDIAYAGEPLASDRDYTWRVRAWLGETPTSWAESTFGTSLLDPDDWTARWLVPEQRRTLRETYSIREIVDGFSGPEAAPIARLWPPQHVRQQLTLLTSPVRARLYVTAKGIYEAQINGMVVGDEVLAPGYDSYHSRHSFQSYDVTGLLRAGVNVVGVTVADGWWAGRVGITGSSAQYGDELAVIWQLSLTFGDGTRQIVGSGDAEARGHRGGHDYADLFIGERFDARSAQAGWATATFEAHGWRPARAVPGQTHALTPFTGEPVVRTRLLTPSWVAEDERTVLVDVGQVIAGRLRIQVEAPEGTEIIIQHSEVVNPDGSFFSNIIGPNKDQCDVLLCGPGTTTFEPSFTFHGFRYARLTGSDPIRLLDASAVVIGSGLPETSAFHTSDERINSLHRNVVWSQRGNFLSIPTDCPQRERAGWTGDFQIFAPAAANNMDIREFAERWLANVRAEQAADGAIPTVVPVIPSMEGGGAPPVPAAAGWSDAVVLVPWTLWQRCADSRALEDNYPAMRRWVDYQWREAGRGVPERLGAVSDAIRARHQLMWNTGWQFGDWLAPSVVAGGLDPITMAAPSLQGEVVAALFHAHSTEITARIAGLLGRDRDERELAARARRIKDAFVDEYLAPDGALPVALQGPHVLALAFGIVPAARRADTAARLVELIDAAGGHLDTGFLSTPYLLDVLWVAGHRDLARRLLWQGSPPSWLYAVDHGATTTWESWEAIGRDGLPTMTSFNHYAFGCVDDFLIRRLLGIEATAPGHGRVRIAPDLDGPLDSARGHVETVHGRVAVAWERRGDVVELMVDLPNGVEGHVALAGEALTVTAGTHRMTVPATTSASRGETLTNHIPMHHHYDRNPG